MLVQNEHMGEFSGPGELAEAGRELLTNPLLDMAVIRGLCAVGNLKSLRPEPGLSVVDALYRSIPEFYALDKAVAELWARVPDTGFDVSERIHLAFPTQRQIPPHFDTIPSDVPAAGPLSMSFRVDNGNTRRHFSAVRHTGSPTLLNGTSCSAGLNAAESERQRLQYSFFKNKEVSHAEQGTGDAVLFRNHPYPAIHGTRCLPGATKAYILDYQLTKELKT